MYPQRIKTYYHRAKRASLPEVIYRTRQKARLYRLKWCYANGLDGFDRLEIGENSLAALQLPVIVRVGHRGAVRRPSDDSDFCLNADMRAIAAFEKTCAGIFSTAMPQPDPALDIRAVWEPARLQCITLALFSGNRPLEPGADQCARVLAGNAVAEWIDKNPFPYGPHYMSAMECGLRIPVFIYCLKRAQFRTDFDRLRLLRSVHQHARWVFERLSLYSSRGNHTVCEGVGLIFGGALFNNTRAGKRWLARGVEMLRAELPRQVLEDGGPAEQSLNYHRFVLDLYWLAAGFLEANRLADCGDMRRRLDEGERFYQAFTDCNGNLPAIGDSDDGRAVAPGLAPAIPVSRAEPMAVRTFTAAGYTVMRSAADVVLTFDHGPLGLPPLFNHGHADALAVTLSRGGRPILVDPGTYRYNGVPEFRAYFKGTRAHNTVVIDGQDQAVQTTGFIWSHPFETHLIGVVEQGDAVCVSAEHTGYLRLPEPVRHQRQLIKIKDNGFVIRDTFTGSGIHEFELNLHFHPDVELSRTEGWWAAAHGSSRTYLQPADEHPFSAAKGATDPLHGWYSPAYGVKVPTRVLSVRQSGTPPAVTFTVFLSLNDVKRDYPALREGLARYERTIENTGYLGRSG